ncbi:MAG: hypothetical protein AB1397_07615 [bacterium]
MEWTATMMTLIAGVVTIIWFIKEVKRENSKVLKAILDVQGEQSHILREQSHILQEQSHILQEQNHILQEQTHILAKIEEGQRKGFERLGEMLLNQTKILERIEGRIPAVSG